MAHRVFVALEVSPELKRRIFSWREKWKILPVRWTPEENLHITLVPPWNVENLDKIVDLIRPYRGSVRSFNLSFTKVLFGSKPYRPSLIWVEGQYSREFILLKNKLLGILKRKETRQDRLPHLPWPDLKEKIMSNFLSKIFLRKLTGEKR